MRKMFFLVLVVVVVVVVTMGFITGSIEIPVEKLPPFGPGYGIAINAASGQFAILDPAGAVVSEWYNLSPSNNTIYTATQGEIGILYHLSGGKYLDVPIGWSWHTPDGPVNGNLIFYDPQQP